MASFCFAFVAVFVFCCARALIFVATFYYHSGDASTTADKVVFAVAPRYLNVGDVKHHTYDARCVR